MLVLMLFVFVAQADAAATAVAVATSAAACGRRVATAALRLTLAAATAVAGLPLLIVRCSFGFRLSFVCRDAAHPPLPSSISEARRLRDLVYLVRKHAKIMRWEGDTSHGANSSRVCAPKGAMSFIRASHILEQGVIHRPCLQCHAGRLTRSCDISHSQITCAVSVCRRLYVCTTGMIPVCTCVSPLAYEYK